MLSSASLTSGARGSAASGYPARFSSCTLFNRAPGSPLARSLIASSNDTWPRGAGSAGKAERAGTQSAKTISAVFPIQPLRPVQPFRPLAPRRIRMRSSFRKNGAQVAPGVRRLDLGHLLGRAHRDDRAAVFAPLRPEIDDEVRGLDHVEVVLDDEQRVPRLEQLPERGQELGDVVEVQPGGRLVENVQQPLAGMRRKMRGDLDPLRLPSRQRRRRLAEAKIAE